MAREIAHLARAVEALGGLPAQAEGIDAVAGLLHNLRNAVAPLLVTLEKWVEEDRLPYRAYLREALAMLGDPECGEDRRVDLGRFVMAAAQRVMERDDERLVELRDAREAIGAIARILAAFTGQPVAEAVDLEALLAREARQLRVRLAGAVDIRLPKAVPLVLANPVQLGQVVANLFVNAAEAMEAARPPRMRIAVTAGREGNRLAVRIADNGEGADRAVLAAAFQRGFSTRAHKRGGIGLSWCADAVHAMGGTLSLESGGWGLGATAVLTLRCAESLRAGQATAAA